MVSRPRPVSCVNYDASFAFLGFYIVRAGFARSRLRLADLEGSDRACRARVIGLDGVVAQQAQLPEVRL